ncbi:DUF3889 domain-containing protein [Alteribacter populi]|uniref:DUF3889 domain-containing protein n=1 Tax=Alteribacter populi TaxID=2011011 RepID=UPI000D095A96|nr:DUF3889 domain-containing protein [Alteribacter populi]
MYGSYFPNQNQYVYHRSQVNPYFQQPYYNNVTHPYYMERQQPIRGQATWTEGGEVTQCGIPWSENQYMTVAVGVNAPFRCGETLIIKNLSLPGNEVSVTVVDEVPTYPPNKINLHRNAFQALGADLNEGVINVEIAPSPELDEGAWGRNLLGVTQSAYPNYNVVDYKSIEKTVPSPGQTRETYDFILQSPQEQITVQGNVTYNPNTNRVINVDLKEV